MKSETSTQHQKESSKDIACGIITLSDSRKSKKADLSGQYMAEEIEARYTLKSRSLIPDEKIYTYNKLFSILKDNYKFNPKISSKSIDFTDDIFSHNYFQHEMIYHLNNKILEYKSEINQLTQKNINL